MSNQQNKQYFWEFWQALPATTADTSAHAAQLYLHDDFVWHGPQPINTLAGLETFIAAFWQPLKHSFPDVQRQTQILFGGDFNDYEWVCATGYFSGTFAHAWLGIPATGQPTHIRFGDFWRFEGGKIRECYMILDVPDVMRQAGYQLLTGYGGAEGLVPGPRAADGILLEPQAEAESIKTLQLVESMIYGLMLYDGQSLSSMGMTRYWSPQMCWYGPSGIGRCASLKEFEDFHQAPFLSAFPDRKGGFHAARLSEGLYAASTGWPSLRATHMRPYLGIAATHRPIAMRVMDWWKRDGDHLVENWVFIDLIDLCLQFGVDLFAELRQRVAAHSTP
ncbi:MAG: ester cyclase [Chloroflexi bacterium]|nr:ester cyclase [Chloroflexota bacterium]